MKSLLNHSVTILATGFVVLLLLSLPLFWGRWLCEISLGGIMPTEWSHVRIQPSGLVPLELEIDPNVFTHSKVDASNYPAESKLISLGISDYFEAKVAEGRISNIYYYEEDEDRMYFDEKTGQIVYHYTYKQKMPDNSFQLRQVQLYAGPEGVSETSDEKLGRFIQPIVDTTILHGHIPNTGISYTNKLLILYDKQQRRFFKINFYENSVTKGPEFGKEKIHEPLQIGRIVKGRTILNVNWEPPHRKYSKEDLGIVGSIVERDYYLDEHQYTFVLDETGRINLLDRETLELAGTAGYLPTPESLFPSKRLVTPKDLLAYDVIPLVLKSDNKYRGMFVASVCREGTAMALAVFNKEGTMIMSDYTKATKYRGRRTVTTPSSKDVYFQVTWAPTLTIAKYLLENLHPPILSLASYAMADSIEATAGYRALFILPNSFIAMKGRDISQNTAERFLLALLIILPSIILAILLTWRVSEDAKVIGLSENARIFWILATIAFGLAAYITYRLTRPEITLVTCVNCGKLRRPDMDRCHRCGSKWCVPELTPPAWRVIG